MAAGYDEDDVYSAYVDTRNDTEKRDSEPDTTEIYYTKPDVKEGFVRSVIDDLVSMKYEYKGQGKKYDAVKRITNSCFTPDTEVLTPDGIKNITDVAVGDLVYSWNKATGEMEVKPVTETIEKPNYSGELVHIQNRNTDLKVTPDHRMMVKRTRHSDEWETVDAGELNEYTQYETPNRWEFDHADGIETVDLAEFVDDSFIVTEDTISAGENHNSFDRVVDADVFIECLGWFITEGSTYVAREEESRGSGVSFSQYKSVNESSYNRIRQTVESLGAHASCSDTDIMLCGSTYTHILESLCGSVSENKHIPDLIFERASAQQKELLLEVLMLGDGDKRDTPRRYSTKSDQLRDDVVKLLWELGYKPTYNYDDGGENNTGVWRIHFTDDETGTKSKQSFRMYRDGETTTAENGVYCVQVEDNHTLVAGRNGKFTNIWNCYGVFGDSNSYGNGFRLFDWRLAESITVAGRMVLEHTADTFVSNLHDMGYHKAQLVGGDTDSVMTKIPSAQTMDETLEASFTAADAVNASYDEFMADTFGIDDPSMHKMEVEIESYADAIFFLRDLSSDDPTDGVKKKYSQTIRWDEGEVIENPSPKSKGFKLVRSDTASLTAEVQNGVLNRILTEDEPRTAVKEYLKDVYNDALDGEVDPESIGIPSSISSDPMDYGWSEDDDTGETKYFTPQPHIRGARYATTYIDGEDIGSGAKPLMFYVKGVVGSSEYPEVYDYEDEFSLNAPTDTPDANRREMKELDKRVDAIAVEDPSNIPDAIQIDWEKMAEKTVEDAVDNIVQTMGWSFDDLVTAGEQSGLAQFM